MIRALTTRYGGRRYRSRVEARWAVFLDACGIAFAYEADGYALPSGPYLPDFWLTDFQVFLEIKGQAPTEEERQKCVELAEAAERCVMLAVGQPDERFQIVWFDPRGADDEDEYVYAIAADAAVAGCFWLVGEDHGRWLGGGDLTLTQLRGGPVFSPLYPAYEAALSSRFDGAERERRFPLLVHPLDHWRAA